jgi:hypothetical protein
VEALIGVMIVSASIFPAKNGNPVGATHDELVLLIG